MEAPNEGDWGVVLEYSYFEIIKSAGFQAVRIPIRWSNHTEKTYPFTINNNFFNRVD